MPNFPSIPDSDGTLQGNTTTLRTIKESVELMTGQRRAEGVGMPYMHVSARAPSTARLGDLWINQTSNQLNYWNGRTWQALITS